MVMKIASKRFLMAVGIILLLIYTTGSLESTYGQTDSELSHPVTAQVAPLKLTVNAIDNVLNIKDGYFNPAKMLLEEGIYKVSVKSSANFAGTNYVDKVVITRTTCGGKNPKGWYWVVEENDPIYIEITQPCTWNDDERSVYAFFIDVWRLDNTGSATLTFQKIGCSQ